MNDWLTAQSDVIVAKIEAIQLWFIEAGSAIKTGFWIVVGLGAAYVLLKFLVVIKDLIK